MAKVRRSRPLPEGTWDLEELGTVQHTSRWGTIARSKGSTLRYYPGCPWEKKPSCKPPAPPFWYLIPCLQEDRRANSYTATWYVAYRRHDADVTVFTWISTGIYCPSPVIAGKASMTIVGLQDGWILFTADFYALCEGRNPFQLTHKRALRFHPCPEGPLPAGFLQNPVSLHPPNTYPPQIFTSQSYIKDCRAVLCPNEPFISV